MKNNLFKVITLIFAIGVFISSCDTVSLDQPEVDTNAAADNARSERAVGDVFNAINSGLTTGKSLSSCPTINYVVATGILTIDYGTGCTGADLVNRTGLITASFPAGTTAWADGTTAVVSFTEYTTDGKKLTGVITVECNIDANQVKSFNITGTDMALKFVDESVITWNSNSLMTMVGSTPGFWSITGSSNGVSRKNIGFSSTSANLLTDPACKWFVGGTLTITVGTNNDVLTFVDCGTVEIKRNDFPKFTVNLNNI